MHVVQGPARHGNRRFSVTVGAAIVVLVVLLARRAGRQGDANAWKQQQSTTGRDPGWQEPAKDLPLTGLSVATVAVSQPFLYAYSSKDEDSYQVSNERVRALEPGLTALWESLVAPCCRQGGSVIDIGAHFGYYSLVAASQGCRFLAAEPVPMFRALAELNLQLNGWRGAGSLVPVAVGLNATTVRMEVPTSGVLGFAHVMDRENVTYPTQNPNVITVEQQRLDAILDKHPLPGPLCMIKVDVEGHEPGVLLSAVSLFESARRPQHIQLELSPGMSKDGLEEMLKLLHEQGYSATEVDWKHAKVDQPVAHIDTAATLHRRWDISDPTQRDKLINGVGWNTNLWLSLGGTQEQEPQPQ